MAHESGKPPRTARLAPEGTFVIQLRSDTDLAHRRLRGRVEHVVSGESEPFVSLDALLAFMARFTAAGAPAESTAKETKEDADEQQ